MKSNSDIEIDVFQVKQWLDQQTELLLLDCREPAEFEVCHIESAVLIPMRHIPRLVGSLEDHRERPVIVVCHHGIRSLVVARWLQENGFPAAQSMAGGMDAWSTDIDSGIPRY